MNSSVCISPLKIINLSIVLCGGGLCRYVRSSIGHSSTAGAVEQTAQTTAIWARPGPRFRDNSNHSENGGVIATASYWRPHQASIKRRVAAVTMSSSLPSLALNQMTITRNDEAATKRCDPATIVMHQETSVWCSISVHNRKRLTYLNGPNN